MRTGEKMSNITAWLDDRGMDYTVIDSPRGKHFKIARVWGRRKVAHAERDNSTGDIFCWVDGDSAPEKVCYTSQKSVINDFLIGFFGGEYKEV